MLIRSSSHAARCVRDHIAVSSGDSLVSSLSSQRYARLFSTTTDGEDVLDDEKESVESAARLYHRIKPRRTWKMERIALKKNGARKRLEFTTLGKPGEVVVLPHRSRQRAKVVNGADAKKDRPSAEDTPAILEKMEDQYIDTSLNILKELGSMYSSAGALPKEEWANLRDKLEKGFTVAQLTNYISDFRKTHPHSTPETQLGQWTWGEPPKMGTKSSAESDGVHEIGIQMEYGIDNDKEKREGEGRRKATRKSLIAERILRDCWNVAIDHEIGHVDLHIPSQIISLLLRSNQRSLEELARSHGVKIDITQALKLIQITGTRRSCELVREGIEGLSSQTLDGPLDVSFLNNLRECNGDLPPSDFIQWMERSYKIAIDKGRDQGTVYYLKENQELLDKARRDLELARQVKSSTTSPFCTYVPSTMSASVYAANPEGAAAWVDRSKPWFRWSLPIPQSSPAEDLSPPLFGQHLSTLSSDILKLLRSAKPAPVENDVEERFSATVGKCLFFKKPEVKEISMSAARLGELFLPRTFTGHVPKIAPFLRRLTPFPGSENLRHHHIRLTPAGTNSLPLVPLDLEIAIRSSGAWAPSSSDLILRRIKAVVHETSIDYLLPENGLDIRFTRTLYRTILEGADEVSMVAPIKKALENVVSNEHAPLPTYCHIPLPRAVIRKLTSDGAVIPESQTVHEDQGDAVGQYLLPAIQEFSGTRPRLYDFLGEKLRYSYHDSTPLFSEQNTTLSLDMDVRPTSSGRFSASGEQGIPLHDTVEQEFHSFYRTACKMAFVLGGYRK